MLSSEYCIMQFYWIDVEKPLRKLKCALVEDQVDKSYSPTRKIMFLFKLIWLLQPKEPAQT